MNRRSFIQSILAAGVAPYVGTDAGNALTTGKTALTTGINKAVVGKGAIYSDPLNQRSTPLR